MAENSGAYQPAGRDLPAPTRFLLVCSVAEAAAGVAASGVDALVFDLCHAADPVFARLTAAKALLTTPTKPIFVWVHPLSSPEIDVDLSTLLPHRPAGILLPACRSGADVQHLGAKLAVYEAACGWPDGSTRILAAAAQVPAAIFGLNTYGVANSRLAALVETPSHLAAAMGLATGTEPVILARNLLVVAASAAGIGAIAWSEDAIAPHETWPPGFTGVIGSASKQAAALRQCGKNASNLLL